MEKVEGFERVDQCSSAWFAYETGGATDEEEFAVGKWYWSGKLGNQVGWEVIHGCLGCIIENIVEAVHGVAVSWVEVWRLDSQEQVVVDLIRSVMINVMDVALYFWGCLHVGSAAIHCTVHSISVAIQYTLLLVSNTTVVQ